MNPRDIARLEAENGLRQFDATIQLIENSIRPENKFVLRPDLLLELNKLAIDGLEDEAGSFRREPIIIKGSQHTPPPWEDVEKHVDEMCDYVNTNWEEATPIHLSAYLLWRLNWIHPFVDGNGRSSRAISYAALCIKLGFVLPGTPTIPDQISKDRTPYYHGLDLADAALKNNELDVSYLEDLLSQLLGVQLLSIHKKATD